MADDSPKIEAVGFDPMKYVPNAPYHPPREVAAAERDRPFTAFRFLVEIEGESGVKGAFTSFSGIKMSNQMVQARVGNEDRGVKDNFPGITEYQHVTLSKGVIGDNAFLQWLFSSTAPDLTSGPQGNNPYRNLRIIALTDTGEEGVVWTLLNAIPAGYQLAQMDASRSDVLTEEIEFAISGVKRTVAKENKDSVVNYTAELPKPYNPGSLFKLGTDQLWWWWLSRDKNGQHGPYGPHGPGSK